jgi:hypothetical protein
MTDYEREEYVVKAISLDIPHDVRSDDLVKRRNELVARALQSVSVDARPELERLLRPDAVDMIHTVPSKDTADLVAQIYALDRELASRKLG